MRILLFGATGMVGQGVLRECLLDTDVHKVVSVGRRPVEQLYSKLKNVTLPDMYDYSKARKELTGFDACFFCLGTSSAGMSEADYRRVTYDLTLAAAKALARWNPRMTFVYVSGQGTDETGNGSSMWARVKGETENALLKLKFKGAYMFRPGLIQPMHGAVSKTKLYHLFYSTMGWLFPLLHRLFPCHITTTERVGRAMLKVAKKGYSKKRLGTPDINFLAES
jgi:uncharacterized protein YbjT (DUF2867 family)